MIWIWLLWDFDKSPTQTLVRYLQFPFISKRFFSSVTQSCPTLRPNGLQHARLPWQTLKQSPGFKLRLHHLRVSKSLWETSVYHEEMAGASSPQVSPPIPSCDSLQEARCSRMLSPTQVFKAGRGGGDRAELCIFPPLISTHTHTQFMFLLLYSLIPYVRSANLLY